MSLVAIDLKNAIKAKLDALSDVDKSNPTLVHNAWATGCKEYITSNAEIQGTYVGTLPGPLPDPLSGTYDWNVSTFIMLGVTLQAAAVGGFLTWKTALELSIKAIIFLGPDKTNTITLTAPIVIAPFVLSLVQTDILNVSSAEEALLIISTKIVDSLKATVVTALTASSTSTSGGSGTTTMVAIS